MKSLNAYGFRTVELRKHDGFYVNGRKGGLQGGEPPLLLA
jgi:beta-galactosidase/beta-glucuronidase